MNTLNDSLTAFDPDIAALIDGELRRQESGLEMIASENYAPLAVMQAQGSVLTNKYAEGYPGRRYYGGCEFVDGVEQLAIDRRSLAPNTPTCNHIRGPPPTPPPCMRC